MARMSEPPFDPERTWQALEERLKTETDPRRRLLLEGVRDHMRTEIRGQLEPLMATLVDEPRYHFWGMGAEVGPKGREAVESFYKQMIATGGNRFEFDVRRIVVDEDAVVTEGMMRQIFPGSAVQASGIEQVDGQPVEAEASYLAQYQILTVWPAAPDGRIMGEDIYMGGQPMSRLKRL